MGCPGLRRHHRRCDDRDGQQDRTENLPQNRMSRPGHSGSTGGGLPTPAGLVLSEPTGPFALRGDQHDHGDDGEQHQPITAFHGHDLPAFCCSQPDPAVPDSRVSVDSDVVMALQVVDAAPKVVGEPLASAEV